MSVATAAASAQNMSSISRTARFYPLPSRSNPVKIPPICFSSPSPALFSQARRFVFVQRRAIHCRIASRWQIGASSSGENVDESPRRDVPGQLGLDELLSVAEALCIVPPAIYSIGCLVALVLPVAAKPFQVTSWSKFFACQYFLLVGAVVIGSLIRWRQWQRLYGVNEKGVNVDLVQRVEKVEQDLRSSVTIVRVLSRQLEKLGIRFRVTRKALKEPINELEYNQCAQTAALAQKNSEATRALAMQEVVLERELGEIQKVLLAMQEQQQKQLELILAIGKAGRILEKDSIGTSSSAPEKEAKELEIQSGRPPGGDNDKA